MTDIATTELKDIMTDRKQVFSLLSRLFIKEVDEPLLQALKESVDVFETDEEAAEGSLELIRGYLQSDDASVLDLAKDYAKALCGAGSTQRSSAYPFESVYTSDEKMLMQEARDGALAWYRRYGLSKSESWHDCEDHLGLELEFAAHLVDLTEKAVDEGDQARVAELVAAQRDYEREHLVNWVPRFAKELNRFARTDFYKGLARFTSVYVKRDYAALESLSA